MSRTLNYIYKGEGVPSKVPRRLTDDEIGHIIAETIPDLINSEDPVVHRQGQELANVMRRDLRREFILEDSWIDLIIQYLRERLLDSVVMTHDRVGTKAAGALVADLQQQVISEKRGGSGKDSGLNQVELFGELVGASANRKQYNVWVYPREKMNEAERGLLRRELVGVMLSDIVTGANVGKYDEDSVPKWYDDVGVTPSYGYHYELELDPIRMNSRGVLPSQVKQAIINSYPPEVRSNMTVITSPYPDGRVDLFFDEFVDDIKNVSILGSRTYHRRAEILVKGVAGVDWISERRVDPSECLLETLQLGNDYWVTYYTLLPALKYCLGESHFLKWLNGSGLVYVQEREEMALYTDIDPRDTLSKYIASGEGAEYQFEIEYSGKHLADFFVDERFDLARVITNDVITNEEMLGTTAARLAHIHELFALVKSTTANIDGRHVELLGTIMSSTGRMTGITAKGMEERGADAISRLTSKQAEKVIREEAVFGQSVANVNLASSRFIGNQSVAIGSTVWRNAANPLAGQLGRAATPEYVASLRGHRVPAPVSSTTKVIREARIAKATSSQEVIVTKPVLKRSTVGRRVPSVVVRTNTRPSE